MHILGLRPEGLQFRRECPTGVITTVTLRG